MNDIRRRQMLLEKHTELPEFKLELKTKVKKIQDKKAEVHTHIETRLGPLKNFQKMRENQHQMVLQKQHEMARQRAAEICHMKIDWQHRGHDGTTRMDPFKIREGLDPLEIAMEVIGQPHAINENWGTYPSRTMEWNTPGLTLSITHTMGSQNMQIQLSIHETELKILGQKNQTLRHNRPEITEKIKDFIVKIRKPWEEWTHEEITEEKMWIALYKEDHGIITENMHNKMVMESYSNPHDKWVKRYFQ